MPQPIDPFSELGRVAATERLQQLAERASLAAQLRHGHELAQERVAAESQVRQMHQKSEEVEEELRRKNPFKGRRHKRDPEAAPSAGVYDAHERLTPTEDTGDHELDVTI